MAASKATEGGEMKGGRGVVIVPERPVRSNQQGVTYSLGAQSPSTAPPLLSNYRLHTQAGGIHNEEKELYINTLRVQWPLFCLIFVQYELIIECR